MFAAKLKIAFLSILLITGFPTQATAITEEEVLDIVRKIDRYGKATENFIKAIQEPSVVEENSAPSEHSKTSQDSQSLSTNSAKKRNKNYPNDVRGSGSAR